MKKDYTPISDADRTADETSFVERYWTEHWNNFDHLPDVSALTRREEYRIMRPFLAQLPKGSRILDGGCGLGEWTVFFAGQGFDVVGLDLSGEIVEKLKIRFPACQFVRGDIRQTGFEAQSFAAYFSWGTFEHY